MIVRIQVRRGTATEWTNANPTLSSGEFGYETDTGKLKIGTGATTWNALGYLEAGTGGGGDGDSAYVYIAYASDSNGTGFTMTFNSALDYIAIKSTTSPILVPQASDFTGLWKNIKGEPGDDATATTDASELTTGILSNNRLLDIPQSKIVDLVTSLASKATPQDITDAINGLIDTAPLALDTLNELAAALGDDPNFATTITSALAGKVNNADVLNALTATVAGEVLDARQGKVLNDLITALQSDVDGKLESITGLITNGTNITITGTGTSIDPYVITASGGASGGQVDSVGSGTGISVNSIDPVNPIVNLNASTVNSLGLADSASQPGHTHTASTITDFDSAVSSNSAVTANTAKTTNATHTGDVTGSGALSIESAIERQSNTVLFDNIRGYIIGNTTAITGNILFDFTGAKIGSTTMMIHQDAGAFTIPATGVKLNDKSASTTVANYIYFVLVDDSVGSEVVHYTITQEAV